MHIDDTTHEHGGTAKVYTYSADYDIDSQNISWTAEVRQGGADETHALSGTIPLTSPGVVAIAGQAVRDAVVAQIDALGVTA